MNWADWSIVGVVCLSCVLGASRGFIREAMSLAVWFLALFVAFFFSDAVAARMVDTVATPSLRYMLAFGGLFLLTMVLGSMVSRLLGQLVSAVGLKGFDRVLGASFGFARGVIIVLVILVFVPSMIPVQEDEWWQNSIFIPPVLELEELGREMASYVIGLVSGK